MYIYIHIHIFIYKYVYIFVYVDIYIYVYIYIYIYTYLYTYLCIHNYTYIEMYNHIHISGFYLHPYLFSHLAYFHFLNTGQGTVALEFLEQARSLDYKIDNVLVCCSGGGLSGGIANVCTDLEPNIDIYTVEPYGFDKMKKSLENGRRVENVKIVGSICDSLLSPIAGEVYEDTCIFICICVNEC
jgi:hypothetical protein